MQTITRENYPSVAKELRLSYSILKRMAGVRPEIRLDAVPCFYDIETEDNRFSFGSVNGVIFKDSKAFMDELSKHRIVCSFNGFRYDNEILFKAHPEYFRTINYSGFELHKLANAINIDMLPLFILWKPFDNHHKLDDLAKHFDIERHYDGFTEEKCKEDTAILEKFWPFAKEICDWIERSFFIDPETLCALYYRDYSKLRRWFLQSWMLQHGIYPALMKVDDRRKPTYCRFHRRGFFKKINVFDVKSSYPTTAIKLKCTLYRAGDFAEYEQFLLDERSKCRGKCPKCGCDL